MQRVEALVGMGRLAEAIEIMEKRVLALPGIRRAELESIHAWILASAGRNADARAALQRLRTRFGGQLPPTASAAAALEVLGDKEAAIALLQQAVARHDPWVWSSRSLRLDRLRKDPRVATLLAATIESR